MRCQLASKKFPELVVGGRMDLFQFPLKLARPKDLQELFPCEAMSGSCHWPH